MGKHNKKRNTAFIYETLIREVVKQTIKQDHAKRNTAIAVLKEGFRKGTQLRKEMDLYSALLETDNLDGHTAEKLIYEALKQHRGVDQKKLFTEQSAIIATINKNLDKGVFNNFVPNYKSLATISQLFNQSLNPKTKVLLESRLIKRLTKGRTLKENDSKVSGLVVKTFVDRYNKTYSELLKEQKELLNKYVSSFQDEGAEFKFYISEEVGRLKEVIANSRSIEEVAADTAIEEKITQVTTLLEDFHKSPVSRDKLLQVLKVQNLAHELQAE